MMPNIKNIKPSRLQAIRQYSGQIAGVLSSLPYTTEELQDMLSYRDYLNEVYSQEAAIRRAQQRRAREEQDYEKARTEEAEHVYFAPTTSGGFVMMPQKDYKLALINKLTGSEIRDELILRENQKSDYMPDSVFESIINKTGEPDKKSAKDYLNSDLFNLLVNREKYPYWYYLQQTIERGNPMAAGGRISYSWIKNIIGDVIDNISIPKQQEEKQKAFSDFHNKYTEKAQKDAFERYKLKLGITDKDVANGKKVINQKQISESEEIYNKLTSPEAKLSNIYDNVAEMIYDPRRNPDVKGGSKEYYKDAATLFLINMNEALIGDFQGRIDRSNEIISLGTDAVRYELNKERITEIDDEIHNLANSGDKDAGEKVLQLLTEKLQLTDDNRVLEKNADLFKNYVPDGYVDRMSLSWSNLLNRFENSVFGTKFYDWTSPIFDDVDPLRLALGGFNSAENSTQKEAILRRYIDARNNRLKAWQEGIRVNEEDIKRHEDSHQVSDYFKYWEQHASGNILDGDTWAFKQPGLMGFSNSSWIKQLPMYIGAIVAPFAGTKASLAFSALGFAGAHSSAFSENYMELRENFRPRFIKNLKQAGNNVWEQFLTGGIPYVDENTIATKSDDEIDNAVVDAFLDGRYKPTSNVQTVYLEFSNSSYGINALFDRDMLAVDINNLVNTSLLFGPYMKLGRLTKFVKPMGEAGSPVLGYSKALFRHTPLGKKLYKTIDDATSFMALIPNKIYKEAKKIAPKAFKTNRTRSFINGLEEAYRTPANTLARKTALENIKNVGRAIIGSGISEGIEEGKQYLAGLAFQRGDLDDATVSFGLGLPDWGKWYDDMVNDIQSAYVIAGIPFNLESTHDPELVENIKGGIMGGLFLTGVTVTARTALEVPSQIKLNKYLLNNVMAEKAARTDLYEKARLYAEKAFSEQDVAYILKRFDDLKEANDKNKGTDQALPDGVIEDMKSLFQSVVNTTRDQAVLNRAELLGFKPGDDNFNKFIAQIALLSDILSRAIGTNRSVANQIIMTTQQVEPIYKYDEQSGKIMRKTGNTYVPYIGEREQKAGGSIESNEEMVNRLNTLFSMQNEIAISVKAAQDLLAQLEASDNGSTFGNVKSSRDFLKRRLQNYINKRLEYKQEPKRNWFLKNLDTIVKGISESEILLDLYRKLALSQVDVDYASMMYQGLMGKYSMHESQTDPIVTLNGVQLDYLYDDPNWNVTFENIVKAYENRVAGDNALYDALERDYIERMEKVEQDAENERRKVFLEQNPQFAVEEQRRSEQKEVQSHITATDRSTKTQVAYNKMLDFAGKIKSKKLSTNKQIKNVLRKEGIDVDQKYKDVVYNSAKLLVKGEITEQLFAMLFVPKNEREQYRDLGRLPKKAYEAPDITIRKKKKDYISPATDVETLSNEEEKQYLPVEKFLDSHPTTGEKRIAERFNIPEELAHKFKKRFEVNKDPRKLAKQKSKLDPPKKQQKQNNSSIPPIPPKPKINIVDDEDAERFEELKKQALAILNGKTGKLGANPLAELLPIGIEMGFYIIKHGTREFIAFGKAMIEQLGDGIRPVLKSVYEGARYFPGAEEYRDEMTSSEDVARINENTFDKEDPYDKLKDDLQELEAQSGNILSKTVFSEKNTPLSVDEQRVVDEFAKYDALLLDIRQNIKKAENVKTIQDKIKQARKLLSNINILLKEIQKETELPSRRTQTSTELRGLNSYETWVKSAVESLSFYSSKIANGQQLSQDDLNNLEKWVAIITNEINNISNLATGNNTIYDLLLNYYNSFIDMGINPNGGSLLNIVQLDELQGSNPEWFDYNTLHTASLNESHAVDDENVYLRDFTSQDDFLTEVLIELKLGGTKTFDGPVEQGRPAKIYAIFTYKGHTFTPVAVYDTESEKVSKENAQFGNTVRELAEKNPGKKIVPITVSRTKGRIFDQPDDEKVSLTDAGLVQDVYTISFDNSLNQFLLTRAVPVAGGKVLIRATKPNKTGKGVSAPYTYSADSKIQTAGNVVYIKEIKGSDRPYLPINIYSADMTEGDAQLIIDILTGKYTNGVIGKLAMDMPFILNGEYLGSTGPERTIGLTARDVLNLILPYGPFGRKGSDIVHLWHSNFGETRVIISGKFKNDDSYTNHEFNLATQQGKDAFKKFLIENVRKNISERVMKSSLGKPGELKDNPMLGLANFVFSRLGTELRKRLQAGEEIQLGESSIIFDWNDLSNDKRQGGITGLGWYVKRGFLLTTYAGINNALVNFTGAKVEDDIDSKPKESSATVATNGTEEKPLVSEEKPKETGKRKVGRVRKSLEKRTTEVSEETRTVDEVRKVLAEIMPAGQEELTVEVSENYLDDDLVSRLCAVSAAAPHVVGRAYADGIELYKHAKLGVAYHEAFHRIAEIFLDDNEREKVYNRYTRFYKLTHWGKSPSIDEIREGTADLFMAFMEGHLIDLGNGVLGYFRKLWNTVKFIAKIGSYGQYKLYSQIAAGRFKNFKFDNAAKERAQRYAEDHPLGYGFTLEGQNFKYILNEHAFKDLVNSLVYFVFHANNIAHDGSNISDLTISKEVIEQSEDYQYYTSDDSIGSLALLEAMKHFEIFAPYIVSAISEFATDYRVVFEGNNQEEAESEDVSAASISEHTHQSYEFSQFSRASSKVRFFFSRIDDMTTKEVDGVAETVDKLNGLGLPLFMSAKTIFNDVLNQLWDVEDLNDLMNRIRILSKDSPVYELIYNRLNKIRQSAYGDVYDVNQEALLVLIFNIIKSNKQSFLLAQSSRYYVGGDIIGYTVTIQNIDQEYNARNYRFDWSNLFAHGGSIFVETGEDGKIRPKKNMTARSMSLYWSLITNIDPTQQLGIAAAFSDDATIRSKFTMSVSVNGQRVRRPIDAKNNKQDLDLCKIKFIQILNCFGILFDKSMLDYMLRQKYGNSGYEGMKQMFEETGVASLNAVTHYMNGTYYEENGKYKLNLDEDGRLNGRKPEEIFAYSGRKEGEDGSRSNGFFGELANYKYQYRHSHDQLSVLAAAGNKYYVISENNYITDSVHFLNKALKFYQTNDRRLSSEIEEFDELCNFSYNLIEDADDYLEPLGSVILKAILNNRTLGNIEVCTLSGMKSDFRGDTGVDYASISRRDDYIAKLQILLSGGIIFPTLSDKKTWTFLKGILLPGINWASKLTSADVLKVKAFDVVSGHNVVDNHGRIRTDSLFSYMLENKDEVVDQLIEYFITEHAAVSEAIEDYKSLPKERRVSNYHGGAKVKDKHGVTHIVIQGARHSSLLNLYDENDELIPISRTLDENGEYIDEFTEWLNAEDAFFALREGETEQDLRNRQRIHVNRILRHRLEEEMQKLEQLGLVRKVGTDNSIFSYENVGIDAKKVDDVYKLLLDTYQLQEGTRLARGANGETVQIQDLTEDDVQRFKALALATVVNDGLVKAIMSKNETERIFSGHPSFFKWGYNNGQLVDRGVDQHKRYGGMVSTGQNAALWARGVNAKYRSAEIDNEEVGSHQIKFFRTAIYEGTLRKGLIDYILDKRGYSIDDDQAKEEVSRIDGLTIDEVKKELAEIQKEEKNNLLDVLEMQAKEKTDDFEDGIDVADGAAYVTDTFFELMLRSIGAWDDKIERAFKILRGEKVDGKVYTINDINVIAEATEAVHTAVIGSQKYTAYGQRMQTGWDDENGHHDGRTIIPFYDKFALFPLFKIICTGKMANIYKAMLDQKVDMLKIKSAIKVGMEGSQPLDWSKWTDADGNMSDLFHDSENGFKFNVYEQRMKYLRKLFNTDPKEKEYLTMGTLMTKVVMQALTAGRMYTTQDGRTMSAKELRDDVMKAMVNIARIGNDKFRKEFFNADGSMNLLAFTRMIKDELSRRGASRDVIDGFSIVKDSKTGEEKFNIALSAQSDISWIQSIIAAAVNKRIIDINTPGNLFIQRSIWGMEGPTKVLDDANLPQSINGGNKLKMVNEEGSMDCILSIDFFEHIIPKTVVKDSNGKPVYKTNEDGSFVYKKDKDGNIIFDLNGNPKREVEMRKMSFVEAKQWLIDNGIISGVKTGETEWSNAASNIVGYRIPTQAVSSIHAFRCVDVLPVIRDTVIMPEEITKVTGSDFDIDKMFLSMLNYKVTAGKARDYDFISDESEWHENRLLKDYIAMLLNRDENGVPRNVQQLHGSIDKDTKLLKDTLKDLESSGVLKERLTYQDYTLSNEVFIKQEYITGKNGIGPFALNNNNHILTMLYGVRFRKTKNSILTRLNLNRLDRTVDRDGSSILSWLSGLINAHVDIAKDPYISRLGVNPFTYNMTNLLIRTGLGKYTFYFLTQPILMELAEVYTNAGGVYGIDKTKTTSLIRRESRQKFIIDYINKNLGTDFTEYDYKDAIKAWEKTMHDRGININQAIDYLFNQKVDILKNVSSSYKQSGDKIGSTDIEDTSILIDTKRGHEMISMFDLQMLVYSAFEQFEPSAQALANIVKYSKIDTKKLGKNITEQRAYMQGVYNTFINTRGIRRMFNNGLYKMYSLSYIKEKTDLAINAFSDILSNQLIQATHQFENQLNLVLNILNKYGDRLNDQIIVEVTDAIIQLIKSRYINDYASRHNIDIKSLVSGSNTIFDRLVKLQIAIKTQDKYKDLLVDGEIQNYLLRSLVTAVNQTIIQDEDAAKSGKIQKDTYENGKFVKLLNFLEEDLMDSDELRSAWQELLEDGTYPELQEFARDLIVYSFVVTGDIGGGMRNLFKFVPNSWKVDRSDGYESYNDYMHRVSKEYEQGIAPQLDVDDLVLNNWRNYNFVPTYTIGRKGGFRFLTYFPEGFDYPIVISGITTTEDGEIRPTFNEDPDSESYYPSPKYLKISRGLEDVDEFSQRAFNVYKRIAFGQYVNENGETLQYPIYALVGPKGNTFNGNYKILEYGREDQSYREVANAVAQDPVIKTLLTYSQQLYTDVESLLTIISGMLLSADQVLEAYNKLTNKNIILDEALRFIASGYGLQQQMLSEGHMVIHTKYSRAIAESDSQNLYIFTDNTDRTSGTTPIDENSSYAARYSNGKQLFYPSVTTAQIRGLDNAFPISSQHYYNDEKKGKAGRWNDSDYDEVVKVVEEELAQILQAWMSGLYKNIILPVSDAFVNSSISKITEERTPKLFKYFTEVEDRIRAMIEENIPLVKEDTVFEVGKKKLYETPTTEYKSLNTEEEIMSQAFENRSEEQKQLGLDQDNNPIMGEFTPNRLYDPTSIRSELNFLKTHLISELKNWGITNKSIKIGDFWINIKNVSINQLKWSMAKLGAYFYDFSVKESNNGLQISGRHTDVYQLTKLGHDMLTDPNKCG